MYLKDHPPPHFHVLSHDGTEALVNLKTLQVIDGGVPPAALKEALQWAAANAVVLNRTWKELSA